MKGPIPIVTLIITYAYIALCLQLITKRTYTKNEWMAWIPIFNIYLMCKVANKPGWWVLLFFVPIVNIVIMVILWMNLSEACGKQAWLGILMLVPLANIIVPGYLAFSK